MQGTRHGSPHRCADGGVRGIATGDTFRRLVSVSKALAREWADKFDQATRPFQLPLQARAGATHVRAALATRRGAVLVPLDGRSAYEYDIVRQHVTGAFCEQGDALAPAFFALGQHEALQQEAAARHPDDSLVAFLDDLYVVTQPSRARAALDTTVHAVEARCGLASNLGKTRVTTAEADPSSAWDRGSAR